MNKSFDVLTFNFGPYYRRELNERGEELLSIFRSASIKPEDIGKPENMNEITDNLFIGNFDAALDVEQLLKNRITHVLNLRSTTNRSLVEMYDEHDITFAHVAMEDSILFDMRENINAAISFIQVALGNGGRVLIHCYKGKSRAPTVATAYLMSSTDMDACQAANVVKRRRNASPAEYFIIFLCDFEQKLKLNRDTDCHIDSAIDLNLK